VLGKIAECFGDDGYRVEIITLAAVVPAPQEEPDDKEEENDGDDDQDQENIKLARGRISREELLNDLAPSTQITRTYLLTVLLSSIIAAVGLARSSAAVVIGAMVIAPLLLPNMSLALGTTLGDFKMMLKTSWTNAAGISLCLGSPCWLGSRCRLIPAWRRSRRGPRWACRTSRWPWRRARPGRSR